MLDEIIHCIHKSDQTLKDFKNTNVQSTYLLYKQFRNKAQKLIDSAKRFFYKEQIEEFRYSPKQLWKSLKNLGTGKNVKTKAANIGLNVAGEISFDKSTVADCFNNFFTTVAQKLVNKLPTATGIYGCDQIHDFYKNKGVELNSCTLKNVELEQILKALQTVSKCKATGLDSIPAKFIRDAADQIAPAIHHIINLSLNQGIVPQDFKNARVVPLYKKSSKTEPGNYRPVSILSILSKILERIVHNQIQSYMKDNNLF